MPARLIALVALLAFAQPQRAGDHGPAGLAQDQAAAGATGAAVFVNGLGMRFVEIPAGSFDMGAEVPEWALDAAEPARQGDFPALAGPYLGQTPPGSTPTRFAAGIVSTEGRELNAVFTPDGRELVCERSADGWGEPRNVGAPVNSASNEFYPSLTRDGTMYFQSRRPGGPGLSDIWRSRLVDGQYAEAECLPAPVNSAASEGDALIAPDESYLIVSADLDARSRPQSTGTAPAVRQGAPVAGGPPPPPPPAPGLFLTLRAADGGWSPLVSLGAAINTSDAGVNCQMLSPDGRYLFFTRGGDIYWVDALVVEEAKRRAAAGAR